MSLRRLSQRAPGSNSGFRHWSAYLARQRKMAFEEKQNSLIRDVFALTLDGAKADASKDPPIIHMGGLAQVLRSSAVYCLRSSLIVTVIRTGMLVCI